MRYINLLTYLLTTVPPDILFPVILPPFSCPSCLEYLRPCALILLKTWRYISRLLTYLLIELVLRLKYRSRLQADFAVQSTGPWLL